MLILVVDYEDPWPPDPCNQQVFCPLLPPKIVKGEVMMQINDVYQKSQRLYGHPGPPWGPPGVIIVAFPWKNTNSFPCTCTSLPGEPWNLERWWCKETLEYVLRFFGHPAISTCSRGETPVYPFPTVDPTQGSLLKD